MWLGVDYYPEQWDPSLLEEDLDTIRELGCNVIRIAEFGWHLMEPEEGRYDFSFFDHVIGRAKERGLSIIMGTPTAAIPAWLAKRWPDILSVEANGQRRAYGGRHTACYHHPAYRAAAEGIVRAMAAHYKDEGQIVAWQIDNELSHEGSDLCWCGHCRRAFQDYLRENYRDDIDALNSAYGTVFWSHTYNGFDEIPLPAPTVTTHNPALRLDWERFRSRTLADFAEGQVRLLKEAMPGAVAFHDFPGGGLDKHADFSEIARPLDLAAYNNYPVWGGQRAPLPPHAIGFALDYIRGLKRQNFWITEEIMGAQGHDVTGYLPRPGQAKMWSWQAMAHGCEGMLYFRYRGAVKGAEQFCYGILDADNVKGRKFREVQDFFREVPQYEDALTAPIRSAVAIVYDFDSLASFRIQRQSAALDCVQEMQKLYAPLFDRNVPVDVIPSAAPLDGYRVVLLPQMILAKPDVQQRVQVFTAAGGTVVLTYRTAVKDGANNLFFGQRLPVGYADFAGVQVEETESLQEGDGFPLVGEGDFAGTAGQGGIFRDMLTAGPDTQVLFRYGDEFYQDYAAVTCRRHGQGWAYYIGCGLDAAATARLLERILAEQGIKTIPSDPGVEVVVRGGSLRMCINHNGHPAQAGETLLPAFGCKMERI